MSLSEPEFYRHFLHFGVVGIFFSTPDKKTLNSKNFFVSPSFGLVYHMPVATLGFLLLEDEHALRS